MIKVAGIVGKVRLEDVEPSVAVIIADRNPHPCLLTAILAVGTTRHHAYVSKRAVVVVVE